MGSPVPVLQNHGNNRPHGLIFAYQHSEEKISCQIVTLIATPSNHFPFVIIVYKTNRYENIKAKRLLCLAAMRQVSNWYLTLLLRIVTPRPSWASCIIVASSQNLLDGEARCRQALNISRTADNLFLYWSLSVRTGAKDSMPCKRGGSFPAVSLRSKNNIKQITIRCYQRQRLYFVVSKICAAQAIIKRNSGLWV